MIHNHSWPSPCNLEISERKFESLVKNNEILENLEKSVRSGIKNTLIFCYLAQLNISKYLEYNMFVVWERTKNHQLHKKEAKYSSKI